MPPLLPVAAISAGVLAGQPVLDLDYGEDSSADVDANFVMSRDGRWIEVQTTAEGAPFHPELFMAMARWPRRRHSAVVRPVGFLGSTGKSVMGAAGSS